MTRRAWVFAIAAAIFLWPAAASADINEPSEIPSTLSDRNDLVLQRSSLMKEVKALEKKIAKHNVKCGQIPENSPNVAKCQSNYARILSEIDAYQSRLRPYELELAKAVNLELMKPPEKSDLRDAVAELPKTTPSKDSEADKAAVELVKQHLAATRKKAKAFAAMDLGAYLMDYKGQKDLAISYLKQARQFFSEEQNPDLNEALNRLIYDKERQESLPSVHDWFPVYESKAQAVLNALDYGNGNWDESVKYLEVALQADPTNLAVRDALNYTKGIAATGESKNK